MSMQNTVNAPRYLHLAWGARNRLQALRLDAGRKQLVADWRKERAWGYHNWADAFGDMQPSYITKDYGVRKERIPTMRTCTGEQFRAEAWADECEEVGRRYIDHKGWFSDADCSRVLRAFVFRLSHGRWGCGYADSDTGERVYLLEVHPDARSAASSADSEAEREAEEQKEYDERWNEARELRENIEEAKTELHRAYALRNVTGKEFDGTPIKKHFRNEVHELARVIRQRMEDLRDNYSDVDE